MTYLMLTNNIKDQMINETPPTTSFVSSTPFGNKVANVYKGEVPRDGFEINNMRICFSFEETKKRLK